MPGYMGVIVPVVNKTRIMYGPLLDSLSINNRVNQESYCDMISHNNQSEIFTPLSDLCELL